MHTFLSYIEKLVTYLLGKGYGSSTIRKEVKAVISLSSKKKSPLIIDIGGNKGNYSAEIIKQIPNSQVVIFEPSKENFDILKNRFNKNNKVRINNFGLHNETTSSTLYADSVGSGLGSLSKRRLDHFGISFSHEEPIELIRFEDYWINELEKKQINICKIDVEGHELNVLEGFGDAINHVDIIQFEFGGCNIDTKTYFQDFWYFFNKKKFQLYRITPFSTIPIKKYREIDETFMTTNFIAKKI